MVRLNEGKKQALAMLNAKGIDELEVRNAIKELEKIDPSGKNKYLEVWTRVILNSTSYFYEKEGFLYVREDRFIADLESYNILDYLEIIEHKNLSIDLGRIRTFEELEEVSKNIAMKVSMKSFKRIKPSELEEGKDYIEIKVGDLPIQAFVPLSYEGSVYLASKAFGGVTGEWCTAYPKKDDHWSRYMNNGTVFLYVINLTCLQKKFRKIAIEIPELGTVNYWDAEDKPYSGIGETPPTEMINALGEEFMYGLQELMYDVDDEKVYYIEEVRKNTFVQKTLNDMVEAGIDNYSQDSIFRAIKSHLSSSHYPNPNLLREALPRLSRDLIKKVCEDTDRHTVVIEAIPSFVELFPVRDVVRYALYGGRVSENKYLPSDGVWAYMYNLTYAFFVGYDELKFKIPREVERVIDSLGGVDDIADAMSSARKERRLGDYEKIEETILNELEKAMPRDVLKLIESFMP